MAKLIYLNGPDEGTEILLNDSISLGKSREGSLKKNLKLESVTSYIISFDASISQTHCIIQKLGESEYQLNDNESTNGTFLNGQKTENAILRDTDFIRIGKTVFQFRTGE